MSRTYIVQKLRPGYSVTDPEDRYKWIEAFGLKAASWPTGPEHEVVEYFNAVAQRSRTPRRLIYIVGSMGGASETVLATANFGDGQ